MKRLEKDPNPLRIQINTEYSAARFLPTVYLDALPLVISSVGFIYVLGRLNYVLYVHKSLIKDDYDGRIYIENIICDTQNHNENNLINVIV